jgi:hypothetical protein
MPVRNNSHPPSPHRSASKKNRSEDIPKQKKRSRKFKAHPGQRLLTFPQIEAEYGLPYRSLYDLYLRGVLVAVRFNGARRLWAERAAIEKLIVDSREVRSA